MINDRIKLLRAEMKKHNIDAYIIPSSDPHRSEYLPGHWQSREWLSGFTGSAGTAVVTLTYAGLWADSRYYIQAEKELSSSEFNLHKITDRSQPQHISWLSNHLKSNDTVAIDAPLFSISQKVRYESILSEKNISIKITSDLIDAIWNKRPSLPTNQIFEHDVKFAGLSRKEKIDFIRVELVEKEVEYHLVTTLDDIAWILNLRGRDVDCNPVFISFVVITKQSCILFINKNKIDEQLKAKLLDDGVSLMDYQEINNYLNDVFGKILVDPSTINLSLFESLSNAEIINGKMPSQLAKAQKNKTEIGHIKDCMIKDGVALTHAFCDLENLLKTETITEDKFAEHIATSRSRQPLYFGESFSAIVGYRGNGAIVHYHPTTENSAVIENSGILLVDSGGQYYDGTTDITRTISLSKPSTEEKNAYTRVLKGHIALANAQFPEGTTGGQLDVLARQYLWSDNMNFLHGTGHGVGFFLNVHEGPQSISPGQSLMTRQKIELGMITSNEPGYYKADDFGIRIENLILTVKAEKEGFLKFETVTLLPIDTQLIELSLMTEQEKNWLNNYHEEVYEKLSPLLDLKYKDWLSDKCKKI